MRHSLSQVLSLSRACRLVSLLALSSSLPAAANGFVALPLQGFTLADGSRSAYTLCNESGKFRADGKNGAGIAVKPSAQTANTCAVFIDSELQAPLPGYVLQAHAIRQGIMNNRHTAYEDKKVANVSELLWRNAELGLCLIGSRVITLSSKDADYDRQTPGKQFFRISDVAHGGFTAQPLEVAYALHASQAMPVFRIGRSFSAVSYQPGSTDLRQPLVAASAASLAVTPAITQIETQVDTPDADQISDQVREQALQSGPAITTAQIAALDSGWVNFSTEIGLPKHPASAMLYIKTACSDQPPQTLPGLIRLRQASRGLQAFIEISLPGFAPAAAQATAQ